MLLFTSTPTLRLSYQLLKEISPYKVRVTIPDLLRLLSPPHFLTTLASHSSEEFSWGTRKNKTCCKANKPPGRRDKKKEILDARATFSYFSQNVDVQSVHFHLCIFGGQKNHQTHTYSPTKQNKKHPKLPIWQPSYQYSWSDPWKQCLTHQQIYHPAILLTIYCTIISTWLSNTITVPAVWL